VASRRISVRAVSFELTTDEREIEVGLVRIGSRR
jgi:hypothetical protein